MTDHQQHHPITPPPELVQQWIAEIWHEGTPVQVAQSDLHLATRAAQWGANTELLACCEWLIADGCPGRVHSLRAARRPRPPSLKEQALKAAHIELDPDGKNGALIIRALEALPE